MVQAKEIGRRLPVRKSPIGES
ncbi:Protein of unknown function [Bacillus mycoides]|nr:Protein of unknown function [Bacillus mycoides]